MPTQAEEIRAVLDKTPLFSYLEEPILESLVSKFEIISYDLGDTIIQSGDPGDSFYVIFNGRARVVGDGPGGEELTLITLSRGDFFGERALITGAPRSATIRASTDIVLARLSKEYFVGAIENDPEAKKFLEGHIEHEALHNFLRQFTILSSLNAKETKAWVEDMTEENFAPGDFIFHQGDEADKFYIILEGKAEVLKKEEGAEKAVTTLRGGDFFGELALLTRKPRAASIRTKDGLKALTLSKENFENLVTKSDSLKEKISSVIALYNLDVLPEEMPFDVRKSAPLPAMRLPAETAPAEEDPESDPFEFRARGRGLLGKWIKRLRYPWIEQYDETDCGAACLAMICRYYGKRISVTRLRDLANVSQQGATLLSVASAAEEIGFGTHAVNTTYEDLMGTAGPAIVHWAGFHYVVVYEIDEEGVTVADPGLGLIRIGRAEFTESWTGFALILRPTGRLNRAEESRPLLGRFFSLFLPYKALLGEVMACSLLVSLLGLAMPVFVQIMIDRAISGQDAGLLNTMLAAMVMVTILSLLISALRGYLMTLVSNRFEISSLSRLYRHILSTPMRFFNARKVGDILARFVENESINDLLNRKSLSILIDAMMVAISLAAMLYYSPFLTLITALFIPIFGGVSVGFSPLLRTMSRRQVAADAANDSFLVESLSGVGTLKAAGAEEATRSKWEALYAKSIRVRFRYAMANMSVETASQFLESLSGLVLLYFGASLAIRGEMTVGQLMAFYILANNVNEPIHQLVSIWNQVLDSLASTERVSDIYIIEPEEGPDSGDKIELSDVRGHIRFENVTFSYIEHEPPVLRNVSFEIQPGQNAALVGRSGSGKTTLVNLLLRFYTPQVGRILIDGHDIEDVSVDSLRKQVGAVLQENSLFGGSVRQNIALSRPEAPLSEVLDAARLASAHDFISHLPAHYDTDVGEWGSSLSGGQRQLVAIARTLFAKPAILVLDEAMSALDSESERAVQKNMTAISQNRTVLFVAHRVTAAQNSDLILVLDNGVIVEQGTHHELMDRRGLYYYLFSQSLAVN